MVEIATNLRDYQRSAIAEIFAGIDSGHLRQIYGAPCGSGKTELAAGLMAQAINDGRLGEGTLPYFIVERRTLAFQARARFEGLGLDAGLLLGEDSTPRTQKEHVMVASIQSLASRHKRPPDDFGMGIIDEAHIHFKRHTQLIESLNALPYIGLSATPLRVGLGKIYSRLVRGPSVADMIRDGWLVKTRCFAARAPDLSQVSTTAGEFNSIQSASAMQTITADVVSTWQELGENRQTICFAVNIAHATELCEQFESEGIPAGLVHHKTPQEDIDELFARFDACDIRVLCSVVKLAVGFDSPVASCAILARPTRSEMLHQQMCGRPMRLYQGKTEALILDHAGNIGRFGPPDDFEMPETLDPGELEDRAQLAKQDRPEFRQCPECDNWVSRSVRECPACGHTIIKPCLVEVLPGVMVDLSTEEGRQTKEAVDECEQRRLFLGELKQIQVDRGYGAYWARVNYKTRFGAWPDFDSLPIEPSGKTVRWVGVQQKIWRNSQR